LRHFFRFDICGKPIAYVNGFDYANSEGNTAKGDYFEIEIANDLPHQAKMKPAKTRQVIDLMVVNDGARTRDNRNHNSLITFFIY
jgi:hypothetical protein